MEDQLQLEIEDQRPDPKWESTLRSAEKRLGKEVVDSWLRDTAPLSLKEGLLVIGAPNATARDWIEKKYSRALAEVFGELHGDEVQVQVVLHQAADAGKRQRKTATATTSPGTAAKPAISPLFAPLPLNDRYTFDSFVAGQSNRFAQAAAAAVAQQPGRTYNPLFIYGGVGLGKTHLLHAVGQLALERNPRVRVAYVSGETFTSHFITSLRENREEEFRRAYRSIDIWLMDDIQFIADKTSTKEEFFHTFNELYLTNRQIVLASDRPPRDLRLMEDRLKSRLESGLMAEVAAPDLETRIAILEKRAAMERVAVPGDVLLALATAIEDNIRTLESALIRVLAMGSLTGQPIDLELASRVVDNYAREGRKPATPQGVMQLVCAQFGVERDVLVSPRRDKQTALARQVAMYILRETSRSSLTQIGEIFGGKAHSTVLYACNKLEEEMKKDASLQATVRALCAKIGSG